MSNEDRVASEKQLIEEAHARGRGATLKAYARLSGPGWLQSAITLGGGSLASALYLGVLAGYGLLWVQPVAMLLGIIMLSAISYVTLSTGKRPFRAICEHVNPVLGWGWILAVLLANLVWSLPQFSLGTAAITQNLLGGGGGEGAKIASSIGLLVVAAAVIWAYDSGARGLRLFELLLKGMVALVVVCFFGVVVALSINGKLAWGEILRGFNLDPSLIFEPAPVFMPFLEAAGSAREWWTSYIVGQQRDVMIAAAATAVGINMTFLLPYSMLRKGWGKSFRGLATFDLSTGLLIPFFLATGCVVIAASSQFHGKIDQRLIAGDEAAPPRLVKAYEGTFEERNKAVDAPVVDAERSLAAMLVKRDAFDLAGALEPLTGKGVARVVFGVGVLGMALSTIIILMLISGFTFCEIFNRPATGTFHRMGCLAAGVGVLGPFVWKGDAAFWLAVPTSVFGMVLLPVAYWTFILMMNNRSLLGDEMPRGRARVASNVAMLLAAVIVTPASLYIAYAKAGYFGLGGIAAFVALAVIVGMRRR